MSIMTFARMLSSHDEGWAWLMRIHPSVVRMYVFYVVPMSMLPAGMLLYAANASGATILGNLSQSEALALASLFLIAELLMVPVMGAVVQRIGDMVGMRPAYHDAFAYAAVVPTPLWLSSLALAIPSAAINALATAAGLVLATALVYEGAYRVFNTADQDKLRLLSTCVLAAGLVAWAALMGLAFLGWSWTIK